jgi:predicted GIY-YIG superfamily endonuclease
MFYTYVLQSQEDDTYYVGYTKDVKKRLQNHNLGKVRYTKGHLPYKLIYTEEYKSIKEAKAREIEIKTVKNIKYFLKKQMGSPDRQTV